MSTMCVQLFASWKWFPELLTNDVPHKGALLVVGVGMIPI